MPTNRDLVFYTKQVPGGPELQVAIFADSGRIYRLWLDKGRGSSFELDIRDLQELLLLVLQANDEEFAELCSPYWDDKEAAQRAEYEATQIVPLPEPSGRHGHTDHYDRRCLLCSEETEERERLATPTEQQVIDWAIADDHREGNEEPPGVFDVEREGLEDPPQTTYGYDYRWEQD